MKDDFLYRDVPAFGQRVFRLGLATNYAVEGADLEWALDQGLWADCSQRQFAVYLPVLTQDTGTHKQML